MLLALEAAGDRDRLLHAAHRAGYLLCRCARRISQITRCTPSAPSSQPEDAQIINNARLHGHRIVAVGTTAVRTLETAAIRSAAYGTDANDPASIQRTLDQPGREHVPLAARDRHRRRH